MDKELLKSWFDEVCAAKKFLVDQGGGCKYDDIVKGVMPSSHNALLLHLEKDSGLGVADYLDPETSVVKHFVYFLVDEDGEDDHV